ncbi:carboxypeptidase regulatory-like domain-containing protein, partial [Candidatus Fermentibacteria bacterium]|nr:carboxypeptidase regulatory-like domain-containing protein [Candidatus Fermentibacteria bacterium]
MIRRNGLALACVLAVTAHAYGGVKTLTLDGTTDSATPSFTVVEQTAGSLRLQMRLGALDHEEFAVDGEVFSAFTIPGGGIRGADGQPGLPVITRLVAVPSNAAVSVKSVTHKQTVLAGYRVFPVQPDQAADFVIDRAAYAQPIVNAPPAVEVGEPALFHSLRVVPLTFSPVTYDPLRDELTVCTEIEVKLDFGGHDPRNGSPLPRSRIPESFHFMYQDVVLNYDASMDRSGVEVGPGTYLVIHRAVDGVLTRLQPLIDWRTRQGFNVLVASTTQTGTTTTTIKNYIQNIYDTADPPLEFVTLAGDADGTYAIPCYSYSGGSADHQYTMLEGGDNLADVHLGRLSFSDLNNLQAIVTKILTYETNPPTIDAGWFRRASLTGDQSTSGITCIQVNQWVKTQLLREGYTQIDTIWSSPFVSQMVNSLNQGLTVFGYRGYLGMSGFGTGDASGLTNGFKLPFALMPTCGTGDFSGSTCRPEAFLRNANGGGIGAVGTATLSTHTRYNNCYYNGAWEGAINGADHRLGSAHTRGKLNLYLNFQYDGSNAMAFSCWNNLMGDPATPMWTGFPVTQMVSYPATLPVGAASVPVTVTSAFGPVEGALVTLHKGSEVHVSGYTDYAGRINLPLGAVTAGAVLVTATKHNHKPYQGSVTMGSGGTYVGYVNSTVDDDGSGGSSGNGNGIVNPAETIELAVALRNYGTSTATGVTATLYSIDPYVTILDGDESFGDIGAGATVWSAEDFDVSVAPATPDGHVLSLDLTAQSGSSSWTSLIQLPVQSAAFEADHFTWGGGGLTPDPGESGTLSVRISNTGSIAGATVTGVLATSSPWITVTDATGSYGSIAVGGAVENTANPFALSIAPDCVKGHQASFTLTLTFNGQAQDIVEFTYPIGTTATTDPTGPDAYGYYAFDNTDTGYLYAPTYSWVEIDPNYGGPGADVGLTDFGYQQDHTKVMTLPFTFRFYGEDYTQISICSNGWVAMGQSYLKLLMNQILPGSGSPEAAICAFWDDLYQSGTNRVYYWHDTANHRYVIQWSRMKNYIDSSPSQTQNVEAILHDPVYYPTPTGDGEILFQYQTVNNSDYRNGYATVGIQNQDHTDGLLYTYANSYTTGSASLTAGRAIRILPIGSLTIGTLQGDVTNASNGGTPIPGVTIRAIETNQTMVTGGDGHYTGSLQEGTYTIRAEHPSFALETVGGVAIVEDETTTVNFSLTDVAGPAISATTVLPTTDDTTGPYVVETTITDYSSITGKHLYYTINGGSAQEAALAVISPTTGLHRAEIPGQPLNTQVEYWVEAQDIAANTSRDPSSGTYGFGVLASVVIASHDMESDQGWTVGATGDDATSGIWVRCDPNGVWNSSVEVQPEDDATPDPGVMCFITGNDPPGSTQGADDVDNGTTTLLSPWFDLSQYVGVVLNYRRWYTNDTGSSPGLDYWVVQVTADGSTWVTLENTAASDRSWALKTYALDEYIALSNTVRLRFVASDVSPGSVVEAGVDDVMLTGF